MQFDIITVRGEPSVIEDRAHESLMHEIDNVINGIPYQKWQIINIETKINSSSKTVSTITGVKQFTYIGIAHISVIKITDADVLARYVEDRKYLQNLNLVKPDYISWFKKLFGGKKEKDNRLE